MKRFIISVLLIFMVQPSFASSFSFSSGMLYPRRKTTVILTPGANPRYINSIRGNNAFFAGASLASGRLILKDTPAIRVLNPALTYLDPYVVSIDGKNYILIKDNKKNLWNADNILGYGDSKDDLFASLKKLESDGNAAQISKEELKKAEIRFARVNKDGSVALNDRNLDYNLNNVLYIDMKNLRTALGNKNQDGTFGYFYVIIKDGSKKRAVPGRVTFEEKNEIQKYIK